MNPSNLAAAKQQVMATVLYVVKTRSAGLNYSFIGENELIASLRPAMLKHGLSVAPVAVVLVKQDRFQSAKGSQLNRTHARVGRWWRGAVSLRRMYWRCWWICWRPLPQVPQG
jgi:hypothetical protein